jgi:hypothetical protein
MESCGLLILGLGLFFLGMHLVGENLRRMSGPSFRSLTARSTNLRGEAGVLGLVFGGLMQSATAVTFILVGAVSRQVIAPGGRARAAPGGAELADYHDDAGNADEPDLHLPILMGRVRRIPS